MPDLAPAMQLIFAPLHVMHWQLHVMQHLPSQARHMPLTCYMVVCSAGQFHVMCLKAT